MKQAVLTLLIAATALTACSKTENTPSDRAESATPDVAVTAAPGVAFNYSYQFRLPAARIAQVQESHAQACEALGVARCRITGMHFGVGQDANDISGSLEFKLDPALARKFGTQGIDAITKAGGKLSSADITGTDAGGAIKGIDADDNRLRNNLAQIEQQRAKLPVKAGDERATLQSQAQELRDQLARNAENRGQQAESLATTPVSFSYSSTQGWLGIDAGAPFYAAVELGRQSLGFAVMAVIAVVGVALPWLALIFALRFLWVRFGRRLWTRGEALA